jgi:carbonic anhydrase
LKTPLKIASGEITRFATIYPMNARPTQPQNDRLIQMTK